MTFKIEVRFIRSPSQSSVTETPRQLAHMQGHSPFGLSGAGKCGYRVINTPRVSEALTRRNVVIATIGYERSSLDDFIATLKLAGVDHLVDIRDRAQSRRPGFSKSALSLALLNAGIDYVHFPELGDPKNGREAARSGDFGLFREIFNNVLASHAAQAALTELEALAQEKTICLMCYERDQHTCHRKIVADELQTRLNCAVKHLGVREGARKEAATRRMRHSNKGATTQIEQVF